MKNSNRNQIQTNMDEEILWTGKSSHIKYFVTYLTMICAGFLIIFKAHGYFRHLLVIPAVWNAWNYLCIEMSTIIVSNQRIVIKHGIINRYQTEVELFRIKSLSIYQPLVYRLNDCADLNIITTDKTSSTIFLCAIYGAESLKEFIRDEAINQRKIHGVKEMDINL